MSEEDRSAKELAAQHGSIQGLLDAVRDGLQNRDVSAGRAALSRLRVALSEHFAQEDQLYFPIIGGLQPARAQRLRELAEAHEALRARFETIPELAAASLPEALSALEEFASALSHHEAHEEELLRSLESDARSPADD